LLLLLFPAIEVSQGGSSSYTGADKTNKNIHKRNNKTTQYKQYKHTYYQNTNTIVKTPTVTLKMARA